MSTKTLLFADDSATMRTVMEKTFQGEDYRVVTVPSGQAAVEKAKELRPDIVIADAGMPGITGYDVCAQLRADPAFAATPIVIMSGISDPYDEARGQQVGATCHIKKPFDTTKLIERVDELCAAAPAAQAAPPVQAEPPAAVPSAAGVPVRPERPSATHTLHAFPRPSVSAAGPAPIDLTEPVSQEPAAPAPPPQQVTEVEPIALNPQEESEPIQVGTLAELAQMSASGGTVPQEVGDDAIEIDPEPLPEVEATPSTMPDATQPSLQRAVQGAAQQLADEVAQVEGLTPEQVQAILALTEDVVERVVWEVVPDLAEAIIKEKLAQLLDTAS